VKLERTLRGDKYSDFPEIETYCREMKIKFPHCRHALSLLIDINEQKGTKEALEEAKEVDITNQYRHYHRD